MTAKSEQCTGSSSPDDPEFEAFLAFIEAELIKAFAILPGKTIEPIVHGKCTFNDEGESDDHKDQTVPDRRHP